MLIKELKYIYDYLAIFLTEKKGIIFLHKIIYKI